MIQGWWIFTDDRQQATDTTWNKGRVESAFVCHGVQGELPFLGGVEKVDFRPITPSALHEGSNH